MPPRSLLSSIETPADLRRLPRSELVALATELRQFVLDTVAQTGGHLGSNLGTVELTIALHYVFNTPGTASSGTSATRPTRTRC
jgi:1-deoxy-D-xylulose-5-phosphate synthase